MKVEADLLNEVQDKEKDLFDDLKIMEEDIIIIELPKKENFVFKTSIK